MVTKTFSLLLLLIAVDLFTLVAALTATSKASPVKVVIAGAGSSVGYLTFRKLMKKKPFYPVGLVRDRKGLDALRKLGAKPDQVHLCDITVKESLEGIFEGAEKVVICTSAAPRKKFRARIKSLFWKLLRMPRPSKPSEFVYKKGERPYEVDYLGQKNIIDLCELNDVQQVVLLGSMGGNRIL